jgi:hypothetical protein
MKVEPSPDYRHRPQGKAPAMPGFLNANCFIQAMLLT